MDYFLARYYSSAQGRFTSPDEPFADQDESEPQSWNLYSYVGNSPLIHTDPFGLFKKVTIDGKDYWQVEPGDQEDYARLSKKTGIPEDYLRKGFGNAAFNPGELLDVSGARQLYNQAEFSRFVSIVPLDQVPPSVRYSVEISPIPLPMIGGFIGRKASSVFGRIAFKGLVQNRPLRQLTANEIRKAFAESGYKLSNHAIKRLKDPRTEALGVKTLNEIKQLLNEGVTSPAGGGKMAIEGTRLKAIVDAATKTIVSFVPK